MNGSIFQKNNKTQFPPYEAFFNKPRKNDPVDKDYTDFQLTIDGGMTS